MKTVTFKALTSSQVVLFPENLGDFYLPLIKQDINILKPDIRTGIG